MALSSAAKRLRSPTALLTKLEVTLADGIILTLATDDEWTGSYGDLLSADLYDGYQLDLRQRPPGWQLPGFDDGSWEPTATLPLLQNMTVTELPGSHEGEFTLMLPGRPYLAVRLVALEG